jgi:hypothetical protein
MAISRGIHFLDPSMCAWKDDMEFDSQCQRSFLARGEELARCPACGRPLLEQTEPRQEQTAGGSYRTFTYFWWVCEGDAPLRTWLAERFTDKNPEPVLVSYGTREQAAVSHSDAVRQQGHLSDGRLVRVDWISPQSRGERGQYIITVERPAPAVAGDG